MKYNSNKVFNRRINMSIKPVGVRSAPTIRTDAGKKPAADKGKKIGETARVKMTPGPTSAKKPAAKAVVSLPAKSASAKVAQKAKKPDFDMAKVDQTIANADKGLADLMASLKALDARDQARRAEIQALIAPAEVAETQSKVEVGTGAAATETVTTAPVTPADKVNEKTRKALEAIENTVN